MDEQTQNVESAKLRRQAAGDRALEIVNDFVSWTPAIGPCPMPSDGPWFKKVCALAERVARAELDLAQRSDAQEPSEAVLSGALVLLLARWRDSVKLLQHLAHSEDHVMRATADQLEMCADQLHAVIWAGMKENSVLNEPRT